MSPAPPIVAAQAPVDKPLPPTTTSNAPPNQLSHHSSPTKKSAFYAPHKPDQVQRHGYQKASDRKGDFKDADDLFQFLGTPTFDLLPDVKFDGKNPRSSFFTKANCMSKSIRDEFFKGSGLVVFRDTERKLPRGHVTETKCRPDITVALEDAFGDDGSTFWSNIRMTGEWESSGTNEAGQEAQAITYVHYHLLARPDLYVVQGMAGSGNGITFVVGIGGFGVRCFARPWGDDEVSKLLCAFIYRTYSPGHFADPSYELVSTVGGQPTWTITIDVKTGDGVVKSVPCTNFQHHYASSPFGTRTHVFLTTQEKKEGVDVGDGRKLAVLKDQVCRSSKRFGEKDLLELIHKPKRVPGVVEAVYHKNIQLPSQLENLQIGREKHRHGLRQLGDPFATIRTVKEMLKATFDLVEVLRFLKAGRDILHRDISIGNVMHLAPSKDRQDLDTSTYEDLYFSDFFLGDGPRKPTSVLLVDFNHGEHLASKKDDERVERTGTALFMARAVELGRPVDIPELLMLLPLAPMPPAPDRYAQHYETFPRQQPEEISPNSIEIGDSPAKPPTPWRHELDHDIESVFWLMLYWAMTSRPKGGAHERIAAAQMGLFRGSVVERQTLLRALLYGETAEGTFHSTFQPLKGLFKQLAGILVSVDRHWNDPLEERSDPAYPAEAFQRVILQYIIDHTEPFMVQEIDTKPRDVEPQETHLPRSKRTGDTTGHQPPSKKSRTTEESEAVRNSDAAS